MAARNQIPGYFPPPEAPLTERRSRCRGATGAADQRPPRPQAGGAKADPRAGPAPRGPTHDRRPADARAHCRTEARRRAGCPRRSGRAVRRRVSGRTSRHKPAEPREPPAARGADRGAQGGADRIGQSGRPRAAAWGRPAGRRRAAGRVRGTPGRPIAAPRAVRAGSRTAAPDPGHPGRDRGARDQTGSGDGAAARPVRDRHPAAGGPAKAGLGKPRSEVAIGP